MDASFFSVIGLFIFVLARGHFSRPHSYPLSATNRIRSAIIERNHTRRKPSVLKVSLFSPLLIVSPSLSVKTNDNLGLDWIPLNFSLSPNLYFPYSSGKTISPSLYPRGPVKKELYKGDQNILYQRRVFVTVNSAPISWCLDEWQFLAIFIVKDFIIIFKVLNVTWRIAFLISLQRYYTCKNFNLQNELYFCRLEFHICNYRTSFY